MNDKKYWLGFNLVEGIGPARLRLLLDHFGGAEAAWRAEPGELKRAGLDQRSLDNLLATRSKVSLDQEMERVAKAGATLVAWDDANYPPRLEEIHDPPPLLYVKGTLEPADEWALAVVGTRRATVYGKEVARQLVGDLARNHITVVSGLARGIDAHAHQAALDAGGRTLAVLGCGIDIVYPREHAKLAASIVEHGALITEYPLGTQPEAGHFPPRNRIISGLALGTLIVEAGDDSGALITADYAIEQDREVFCVPGNIFNRSSRGTNKLIQQGAKLVLSVQDILEELNLTMVSQQVEARQIIPENATEATLLQHLSTEPTHIDELGRQVGLPIATVSSVLALMELKGMVRQVGGMNYVVAREARAEYRVE